MYKYLEDFVGNTPLVKLKRIPGNTSNTILVKLEGNNPAGSVKDRPALSMITRAEARGDIKPGDTLIEATSGNTGIALAMAAAMKGYKMLLVMPENQSVERRQTMKAFGAELLLTPKDGSMELARDVAMKLQAEGEGIVLDQFGNMQIPGIRKWPEEYLPSIYEAKRVDELIYVSQADAEKMTRRLAAEEGIFAGISSGGALHAALQLSKQVENAVIVSIVCDRGDRYLSTGVFPS